MWTLFREGGYPMYFVLGFGFAALGWAAWYAARGTPRSLRFVIAMMAATFFSVASGTCADFGATFKFVGSETANLNDHQLELARDPSLRFGILMEGASESMAPGIMGFSLLALTSMLLAVGGARVASQEPRGA